MWRDVSPCGTGSAGGERGELEHVGAERRKPASVDSS